MLLLLSLLVQSVQLLVLLVLLVQLWLLVQLLVLLMQLLQMMLLLLSLMVQSVQLLVLLVLLVQLWLLVLLVLLVQLLVLLCCLPLVLRAWFGPPLVEAAGPVPWQDWVPQWTKAPSQRCLPRLVVQGAGQRLGEHTRLDILRLACALLSLASCSA